MESQKVQTILLINSSKTNIEQFNAQLAKTNVSDFLDIKVLDTQSMGDNVTPFGSVDGVRVLANLWGNATNVEAVLKAHPNIEWINSFTAGVDSLMSDYIKSHPATITNSHGVFSESLGEFITFMMLWFTKNGSFWRKNQLARQWKTGQVGMLSKKTMGIIGYGDIGMHCAKVANRGFNTRVLAVKRDPSTATEDQKKYATEIVDSSKMDYVLAESDFIVNICPLTESTRDMFNKDTFAKMKNTAVFMNIGRGPSVVEEDLAAALKDGTIAGAFLDVYRQEPHPTDTPFWEMENVFMTPHNADNTEDLADLSVACFVENAPRFVNGEVLKSQIDKTKGY